MAADWSLAEIEKLDGPVTLIYICETVIRRRVFTILAIVNLSYAYPRRACADLDMRGGAVQLGVRGALAPQKIFWL